VVVNVKRLAYLRHLPTGYVGPNIAAQSQWLSIAPDPTSNRMGLASVNTTPRLYGSIWSGTAWACSDKSALSRESGNECCPLRRCSMEKDSGKCIIVGAQVNTSYFGWSTSQSGGAWSAWATDTYPWTIYLSYLELMPDPNTDNMLVLGIDRNGAAQSRAWGNSAWNGGSSFTSLVSGWTAGTLLPYQPAQIALDLYDNVPPVIVNNMPAGSDSAWRNASGLYNVSFTDLGGSHLAQVISEVFTGPGAGTSGQPVKHYTDGAAETKRYKLRRL